MKRIKKAKIEFISLVPKGKNKTPVLYKEDGNVEWETIVRKGPEFEEKGELLTVVYSPERPDEDNHIASKEVVKEMAYTFQKEGGQIDIRHNGKALPRDKAYVAENFIIQKGDPRFSDLRDYYGESIDATDSWGVVLKLEDPELRKLYRDDGWQGVSMLGPAIVQEISKESTKEEYSMKPEELEQVMEKSNTSLLSGLTNLVKELFTKKEEPKEEPKPKEKEEKKEEKVLIFKGDSTNVEDIKAHELALLKQKLEKEVDWSDPESVKKYRESLEKEKPKDKEEIPELVEARKEKVELEERISKLEKSSNQPISDEKEEELPFFMENLTKEELDGIELGRRMGRYVNGEPLTKQG